MQVLIMRHGQAVDSRLASTDAERHLTTLGRRESARAGAALRAQGMVPTHIYASPYVRAMQTACAVAQALGYEGEVPALSALIPGGAVARIGPTLEAHGAGDRILLVSHEPTVRALSAQVGNITLPPFPTSGVAVFERLESAQPESAQLLGRLDPRVGWRGPADLDY